MARKTVYVDDIDGSDITEGDGGGPVRFSLNDDYYTLDLSAKNLAKLEKALQPFIDHAVVGDVPVREEPRRRGRSATTTRTKVQGRGPEYLQAVRTWARANGYSPADRGRVAAEIIDAYEAHLATR